MGTHNYSLGENGKPGANVETMNLKPLMNSLNLFLLTPNRSLAERPVFYLQRKQGIG